MHHRKGFTIDIGTYIFGTLFAAILGWMAFIIWQGYDRVSNNEAIVQTHTVIWTSENDIYVLSNAIMTRRELRNACQRLVKKGLLEKRKRHIDTQCCGVREITQFRLKEVEP